MSVERLTEIMVLIPVKLTVYILEQYVIFFFHILSVLRRKNYFSKLNEKFDDIQYF